MSYGDFRMKLFRTKIIFLILISCIVPFLNFSPAFSASKPDWLEGKSRKYPDDMYLIGVGFGDTRKAAEDAAYAALSRIFQADIQSKTSEWEKYVQTDVKGKSQSTRDIKIDQLTSVATNKVLEDVTVADIYVSESEKLTYALAVMERQHAMESLKEKIAAADKDILELQKQASESDDKIERVRALRNAMKTFLNREVYNTDLRIISTAGKGIDPPVSLVSIKQKIQDLLTKQIHIGVQVDGPHRSDIRSSIIEGLTKEGFSVEEKGDPAKLDILVKSNIEFENADLPQWKFVRWNITVDLVNQKSEKVFGSFTRNGREGHLNFKEAEAKSVRALQKEISGGLSQMLVSFIYGVEEK
ncbi:MAG: LPP20 family lipoprotein [Nitrospirae bacterium]|nr:LPP20 family lipoprotein [Nitrospirota bacterium]